MSVNETRAAIEARRVDAVKNVEVIPEYAFKMIERTIELNEAEALRLFPDDLWERVHYWKKQLLADVAETYRGRLAAMYHEYIAKTLEGESLELELATLNHVPGDIQARCLAEAYATAAAGLDGYSVELGH